MSRITPDLALKLTIIGIIIIIIGFILMMFSQIQGGWEVSGAIVIFPFIPLPLGFGFGKYGGLLLLLTIILGFILILAFLIMSIYLIKRATKEFSP